LPRKKAPKQSNRLIASNSMLRYCTPCIRDQLDNLLDECGARELRHGRTLSCCSKRESRARITARIRSAAHAREFPAPPLKSWAAFDFEATEPSTIRAENPRPVPASLDRQRASTCCCSALLASQDALSIACSARWHLPDTRQFPDSDDAGSLAGQCARRTATGRESVALSTPKF